MRATISCAVRPPACPRRSAVDSTMTKDQLVARLRETFQFCEQAFAKLDDSKLTEPIQLFGPNPFTRAAAILITVGDWADHYSQEANYLRLNGILPPTAQRRSMVDGKLGWFGESGKCCVSRQSAARCPYTTPCFPVIVPSRKLPE